MTQNSWANAPEYSGGSPVANTGVTSVDQYRAQHRWYQDDGVDGDPSGTALKVTAAGSTMTVSVAAGVAHVNGHPYQSTAAEALTIGAAGGSVRYDAIVLRSDDTQALEVDRCKLAVKANAGSPPTITRTAGGVWEMPLALVQVDPGVVVIAPGKVTDLRPFMGLRIGRWTTATRPTGARGVMGFNFDTGLFEGWDPATSTFRPIAFGYEPIVSASTPAVGPAGQQWIKV